ncbi:UNVERIFIED_CONTAM: hypothetical protein K2H54_021768 [Gekko kuhli]
MVAAGELTVENLMAARIALGRATHTSDGEVGAEGDAAMGYEAECLGGVASCPAAHRAKPHMERRKMKASRGRTEGAGPAILGSVAAIECFISFCPPSPPPPTVQRQQRLQHYCSVSH